MKSAWFLLLLLSVIYIAGCGGDNKPINEGKDRPTVPKQK
jgi:hypothetical protein